MNNRIYILSMLLAFIFISCKKHKDTANNTPSPKNQCATLSSITGTNDNGENTGMTDATDWRLDDTWSQCEQDLFGSAVNYSACILNDTLLKNLVGYPNPTADYFSMAMGMQYIGVDTSVANQLAYHDSVTTIDFIFINQHNQQIGSFHMNQYQFNRSRFSLNSMDSNMTNTIFRVYYKITNDKGCVGIGHGDVIRQ